MLICVPARVRPGVRRAGLAKALSPALTPGQRLLSRAGHLSAHLTVALHRRSKEVLTIGLTWRDAVSSCAIAVIVITYAVYLGGTSLLLISSAWATSAVILVLGIGCADVASGDLYTRPQPRIGQVFRWIATGFGTIAVIAGLIGLITGSTYALEILVVVTIAWLATGIFWHVLTIGSER